MSYLFNFIEAQLVNLNFKSIIDFITYYLPAAAFSSSP